MIAPGASRDGDQANQLIRRIVDHIGRVLILAPSDWRLQRAGVRVLPDFFPTLGADDIEESITPFTSTDRTALLLANRYDGIDLPGDACRLIILTGLPTGTHLQERFLDRRLGARHALSERIRTRITQGVGRATRSRRDTAIVALHGDDLIGFLTAREDRETLRSEIQAELEIAFETSAISDVDAMNSVRSFLAQDSEWQPTEDYLRKYAEEHSQMDPPGARHLADAVPHEVAAWREAWRGDYAQAVSLAQQAAASLNHPTMVPYRAWWLALAASWSVIASGSDAAQTVALTRQAAMETRQLSWRPRLSNGGADIEPSEDDLLTARAGIAVAWLRRRFQSPKFERELTAFESAIDAPDATKFEIAVETLGVLLGFNAKRPANQDAAPDGAWQDGYSAWILWEAKTEEKADGEVSAEETRQANSHSDWIRHNYSWTEPEREITVIVTPKQSVHSSVPAVATEGVHLVEPSVIARIGQEAAEVHRQFAGELVGLSDADAAQRMAGAFKLRNLDTPALIERLAVNPLRTPSLKS